MTLPVVKVEIDFSTGASFGFPFILDSASFGILDTNILADGPLDLQDITSQVRRVTTRRGRNRILSNFEAGTATVVLNDPNGDFNPQNPTSPYAGKLLPLRKIRIYAEVTVSGVTEIVPMFAGYINSFDTSFYQGVTSDTTVTLQCTDAFRLLANVSTDVPAIPGATAGQLSGARIETLLAFGEFPDSMQFIFPGQSTMQVDPGGNRSLLQAIQTVEQSEFGGFFTSRAGRLIFFDRNEISQRADIPPRLYSDESPLPANTFPYSSVDFAFDDQLVLNDVSVQIKDGTAQIVNKDTYPALLTDSTNTYFYKSATRTGLLMQTDTEALDQALTLVAARKDAELRIDSMTINLNSDISEENTFANVSMDIYTLINVVKTTSGTAPDNIIEKELFVQGVQHDVTPGNWRMTLYTAEPIIQAFILDSNTQGILALTDPPNTNALSY